MCSPSYYLLIYHDYASECIEQTKSNSPKNWNKSRTSVVEGSRALICTLLMDLYCNLLKQVHTGRVNSCSASKCHFPLENLSLLNLCKYDPEGQRSRIETPTLFSTYLAIYSPLEKFCNLSNV